MLSNLNKLKDRLQNKSGKVTIATEFYFLAKELGCLGDLLGREYEIESYIQFWKWKIPVYFKLRQKAISIPAFISMMEELEKDYKNQEKQMKKAKGRKR